MIRNLLTALASGQLLILSACGSSTPSAADTATSSLKAELVRQSASAASPFTFSDAQAQCAASRVVSAVGTTGLQRYGLLNAENQTTSKTLDDTTLSAKDATSVVNAIIDCLGSTGFTSALTNAVSKSIGGAKTAAQRTCLEGKLTVSTLKPMLIATLSGDRSAAQSFAQGILTCMPAKK